LKDTLAVPILMLLFSTFLLSMPIKALDSRLEITEGRITQNAPIDWAVFRFNPAHLGRTPEIVNTPFTLRWSHELESGAIWSAPSVVKGIVYIASDKVYALNATTGSLIWTCQIKTGRGSSPAIIEGTVYIGSMDGKLYALDAKTGAIKWSYQTGGAVESSPTISTGAVYFVSDDGKLYAIDAYSGTLKWNYCIYKYSIDIKYVHLYSSPAVKGQVVYVGSDDMNVYALDTDTGSLRWKYQTMAGIHSSPAINGERVYIGSGDGNVYALDALTGRLEWRFKTGDMVLSSPAVDNGIIYIGSMDGKLYALDVVDGSLKWVYETGGSIPSSPTISGKLIFFVSNDKKLYALDSDSGNLTWSFGEVVWPSFGEVVISGGAFYVGSFSGEVYAFTGARVLPAPDFEISVSPSSQTINSGQSTTYALTVTSINGFSSEVSLGGSITPSSDNVSLKFDRKSVTPPSDGSLESTLTVTTNSTVTPDTYTLTITGTSEGKTHSVNVVLIIERAIAQAPWPMFRHDNMRTGYTKGTAPNTNQTLWKFKTGGEQCSSPAVVDGKVFVSSLDGYIYALDENTGTLMWKFKSGGFLSPTVANGRVFVVSAADRCIYSLNASTGTLIWEYKTGLTESSPAVVSGKVFVGSYEGLYSLDENSGKLIWKVRLPGRVLSPAFFDGKIFVISFVKETLLPSNNTVLYALDENTGEISWSYTFYAPWRLLFEASPAIADNKVFFGQKELLCLNASSGELIWVYNTWPYYQYFSSPAIGYGMVFVGGINYTYALHENSGELIWKYKTGDCLSSPAVADGKVFISSYDGILFALDAHTGATIWTYKTENTVTSSPAVANGRLFVGSGDGYIYVFGAKPIAPKLNAWKEESMFYKINFLDIKSWYELFDVLVLETYIDSKIIAEVQNYGLVDHIYAKLTTDGQRWTVDLTRISSTDSLGTYEGRFRAKSAAGTLFSVLGIFFKYITKVPVEELGKAVTGEFVTLNPPVRIESIVIVDKYGNEHLYEIKDGWLTSFDPTHTINFLLSQEGTYVVALSKTNILVIDSQERKVGSIYEGESFIEDINEIPGAFYSGHDNYPSTVFIPTKININTIIVYGVESGSYSLCVVGLENGKVKSTDVSKSSIGVNEEITYEYIDGKIKEKVLPWYQQYWYIIAVVSTLITMIIIVALRRKRES